MLVANISNVSRLNAEIIASEAIKKGFNYNGENLFTYHEWVKRGYAVIRGQKSFIKSYLWTNGEHRRRTIQGLFTKDQVQEISKKMKMSISV